MIEPRWLTEAEQQTWRAYVDATRMLFQALDAQLQQECALSLTDYELLMRLSEAPDWTLRMRDLARQTQATRSGATRSVTRLEQAGLVTRESVQSDRRGVTARLTHDGHRILTQAAPRHVEAVRLLLMDHLSTREAGQLHSTMSAMRGRITQLQGEQTPPHGVARLLAD